MTRYTIASQRRARREEQKTDPLWAGIGCVLMVVIPLVSYIGANIIMKMAVDQVWPIPYQLVGYPVVSPTLWKVSSLAPLWGFIQSQPNLYGVLLVTLLLIVILGTAVSVGYAYAYRVMGPPRYTELDAPPERVHVKRYKR